jgi:type I restriction enzyme M protein
MNLSNTIKSIQDIMRKDDGVDGDAQRLGQLTWMLFLKIFDQREEEWEKKKKKPKYKSPLDERMRWRNWAASVTDADGKKKPQTPAGQIVSFVNNELFPTLKQLNARKSPLHQVIRSVFEDTSNYMKSGAQMLAVIEKLEEGINFHDFTTRTSLGDVYEQLLNDLRSAGNAGEFYTPRAITQFMVDRVNPRLDKREKVLDPACGTGGFLTAAIVHLRKQLTPRSSASDRQAIERLIRGYEKKQLPHLLCMTNLLLHGIDVPSQIERKNTLAVGWGEWGSADRVMCLIINPPFGGSEDSRVGSDYPPEIRTRETADMFMGLIIEKLLEANGRAAVVLPDGFLFGEGIKATLKKMLLRDCKLHTIVRLPKGVFAPYTTIATNLLFFTKGEQAQDGREHFHTDTIWLYEHPYPASYKSYSKTKPIRFEEFAPEQAWWGHEENDFADRRENAFAWKIDFKTKRERAEASAKPHWDKAQSSNREASALEIQVRALRTSLVGSNDAEYRKKVEDEIERLRVQAEGLRSRAADAQTAGDRLYWPIYNLDVKNPNAPGEESHDPEVLLEKYMRLLGQIEEAENQLKGELAAALAHHVDGERA